MTGVLECMSMSDVSVKSENHFEYNQQEVGVHWRVENKEEFSTHSGLNGDHTHWVYQV